MVTKVGHIIVFHSIIKAGKFSCEAIYMYIYKASVIVVTTLSVWEC